MVSTQTQAVLRIVLPAVSVYVNTKFFFGAGKAYRQYYILALVIAFIVGVQKAK